MMALVFGTIIPVIHPDQMRPPYPSYVLDRIRSIAAELPTEEVGGVVLATPGAFRTVPIKNCSFQPEESYIPYGIEIIEASKLGHLEIYWHTHINGNSNFSPTDINSIWENDFPWLLYDLQNDTFNYFDPMLKTPLLGRTWELGLTDCWGLTRDFYRWHLDIDLPPPEHNGKKRPWIELGWNRPLQLLPKHFKKVSTKSAQAYDIILYENPNQHHAPCHFGVILPTISGLELLHHFYKLPSKLEPIFQPDRIHSIWRSKCPISPSNYSVLWGVDSGTPTSLQPPDLVKVSVT
jgi:proteasome lid subunit RPN8/RPN11